MATYEVTGPDGELYEFEGPDDATEEQLYAYVNSTFGEAAEPENPYAGRGLGGGASSDGEYQYESDETGIVRDVADVATGFVSGVPKAAGALVSIGSLVPGLHYVADPLASWLQKGGEAIDEALLSDRQQEINQELSDRLQAAAGELGPDASTSDYIDAMISQGGEAGSFVADHPGQVANLIATSIPYIFGGGAATKGLKAGAEALGAKKVADNLTGVTGAAVGEGTITAGEVEKNIIAQTDSVGDYSADRLAAIPAGIGTAGISMISGRMANKAGVTDVDVAVTDKITGASTNLIDQAAKKGLGSKTSDVVKGAVFEGGEELLQGAQEKVFENLGTGEHLLSDVGGEAVMGMAAGAGQGAGINVVKGITAKDEISEAQKEADAKVKAEQAQALEDDEFISEAMAISSTEENVAFGKKWAEKLGVSETEVFNDPRFGIVNQNLEAIEQETVVKDLRYKHRETFPDEAEWNKEHDAEVEQTHRANIANPETELGAAFVTWSKENDIYDTNEQTVEDFLAEPATMDLLSGDNVDEGRAPYLAALDAHANFKEIEANRTEEEQAQATTATNTLLEAREAAIAAEDTGAIFSVEQKAAEVLDPAEWAIAKRNAVLTGKNKKGAKKVTPVVPAKQVGAEAPTETVVTPSPYREGSKKDTAYKEATEALGDLEAYPDVVKSIDSKKGVYGKGETPFQRALAKANLQKRLADLNTGEQLPEGSPIEAESSDATANVAKKLAAAVASGEVELTNTQVKVLDVVLDAIENNTVGEYFYGDSKTGSAALAKAAGLKGRSTADSAIKSIRGYFTDVAGEGTKEQLKKTKLRTEGGKTLKEGARSDMAQAAKTLETSEYESEDAVDDDGELTYDKTVVQDSDETTTDENTESNYERTETAGASREDSQFGSGMGNIAAGGSQANIAAPDAEGKAWVNKKAKEKAKKEDKSRLNKARKEQEELVSRVMGDKAIAKQVVDSWNENKPEDAGSFNDMETTAKFVWINAVASAMESGDPTSLVADATEISKKFSNKKEGKPNAKTDNKPKTKNEKVVKGQRKSNKQPAGDGAAADGRGKKSTEKVRKPKVVAKKKASKPKRSDADTNKAAQKQMDHADKALGDDWMMNHPKLMEMLKNKKFGAFGKEVDKIAAKEGATKESLGSRAKNTNIGHKRAAFAKIMKDLFGGNVPDAASSKVYYFDTLKDLQASEEFKDSKTTSPTVEGVVFRGNVAFILDNIAEGSELSLFMHEVGSHIGMDSLMGEEKATQLSRLILEWSNGGVGADSKTVDAAINAVADVEFAQEQYNKTHKVPMSKEHVRSELIAYFIEAAVHAGIKPTPTTKAGAVLQKLIEAFQNAFDKFFGVLGTDGGSTLTMQNVVDLAYGAAKYGLVNAASAKATTKESINAKENKKDISRTRKAIRSLFGDTGIQHWETISNAMKKAASETKFLHQFIEENKVKMPSASVWFDHILKAQETKNEIKRHVEGVAVLAREMSDERLVVVNKFIADSTLNRAWGYDPKIKGRKVKVDKEYKARFDKLNDDEQALVKGVFAHGEDMRARKAALAKSKGMGDKFFTSGAIDGPYAPLKRFGRYVTELKSEALLNAEKAYALRGNKVNKRRVDNLRTQEAHYVVSFFDTKGEAARFRDDNAHNYKHAVTSPRTQSVNEGRTSDHKVLSKVLGNMRATLDPMTYKSIEPLIQDMYMSSLDDNNARESQAKREGVAGFDSNMVRSFLSHSRAESNLIAQMEHGSDIAAALVEAEQEMKKDPENLGETYQMIVKHYQLMVEGKETPVQDVVAAMNTVYMLTSSVGYHLTNATQPMMVSIPVIAATFGDYKGTWESLMPMYGTGYKMARDIVSFKKQNDKFFHRQAEVDFDNLDPKYRDLFAALQGRKLLDVGLEQDLAEFTRMNTGSDVVNRASGAASDVTHRLFQAARVVEMYNRVSTAVAAHDMALKHPEKIKHLGMTPSQFAIKIVQDTQGDFSNEDAPRILKRLPKLVGQYRKYQFMMAWVYSNATKAAFSGATAEEKAIGWKTIGYMLLHAGMFGGVRGLPFIGGVAGVYALLGPGEEPEDIERIIHEYIGDEDLANLVSRGLPAALGIDMSTKLSQDKIFHPLPFVDFEASQEGLRDMAFGVMGPTGNTASNFMRSFEYANEGNAYRAVEYALPKGIRSVMESYRLATEGYSLRSGKLVADPSHFNKLTLLANALGIPAADVSKLKWTRGQQFELQEYFSDAQSDIRRQYIKADKAGDSDKIAELEEKFDKLQDDKDRMRPFFNDNYGSLKRTSIRSLLMAPIKHEISEEKYKRELGTD